MSDTKVHALLKIITTKNIYFMQVYPTQTIYTFEQDGVQLILTVSLMLKIDILYRTSSYQLILYQINQLIT